MRTIETMTKARFFARECDGPVSVLVFPLGCRYGRGVRVTLERAA